MKEGTDALDSEDGRCNSGKLTKPILTFRKRPGPSRIELIP